jgi:hypothetical protein
MEWARDMSGFDRYAGPEKLVAVAERTRRASPRARVSWTVWARVGQERMRFHAVDVSPRGAKLRPRGGFPVGAAIELEFIKPAGRRLHVSAVVWRADSDGLAVLFLGSVPTGFGEAADRRI